MPQLGVILALLSILAGYTMGDELAEQLQAGDQQLAKQLHGDDQQLEEPPQAGDPIVVDTTSDGLRQPLLHIILTNYGSMTIARSSIDLATRHTQSQTV